jgi:EpsI family protein
MMPEWAKTLVPFFLAGQGLLVYWTQGIEHPPAPPSLAEFPAALMGWAELREDPIDADVANTLRADRLLSRIYVKRPNGLAGGSGPDAPAGLLVAWFQSQRAGASQPHSPKVCLPASGWMPQSTGLLTISTAGGPITVNRYVAASRYERAVILYWYQTSRRTTAGEWASKFWLVADALRDRRTDTALVRIVVESTPASERDSDRHATATATAFARAVYPVLVHQLPR